MEEQFDDVKELLEELKPFGRKVRSLLKKLGADFNLKSELGLGSTSELPILLSLAALLNQNKIIAPKIDLEELARHIDTRDLVEILGRTIREQFQNISRIPYVSVSSEWYFDYDNHIEEANRISSYLMKNGWKPHSYAYHDEKSTFDGTLKLSEDDIEKLRTEEQELYLFYSKDGSWLRLDLNFVAESDEDEEESQDGEDDQEMATFYLTDYYPGFRQGVEDLELDPWYADQTKKRLLDLLIELDKELNEEFDPEDTFSEDDIELEETADFYETYNDFD